MFYHLSSQPETCAAGKRRVKRNMKIWWFLTMKFPSTTCYWTCTVGYPCCFVVLVYTISAISLIVFKMHDTKCFMYTLVSLMAMIKFFTILSIVIRTFWWSYIKCFKEVLNNHGEKPCNLTIIMFIQETRVQ